MSAVEQAGAERTYRAIGRFIFEFSQVEYTIRYYLADQIGLHEEHFSAIVESYDVALLITVAKQVFKKPLHSGAISAAFLHGPRPAYLRDFRAQNDRGDRIETLLNRFLEFNFYRNRVAHGLWVPSMDGGTVVHVPRNKLTPARFADQAVELEKRADELCKLRADLENAFTAMPE